MPIGLEAATLSRMRSPIASRMRSPIASRSNCANGEQYVERETAHRGGGVELLGNSDERHCLGVKQLDHPGKVGERAGQPVHLVDHHHVDEPRSDILEE